jgi:hypothetical protein
MGTKADFDVLNKKLIPKCYFDFKKSSHTFPVLIKENLYLKLFFIKKIDNFNNHFNVNEMGKGE